MKKSNIFSTLILLNSIAGFSQMPVTVDQARANAINTALAGGTNQSTVANNQIVYNPGATINGYANVQYNGYIDPTVTGAQDYLETNGIIDGTTRTLDTSNSVPGAIGGSIDVSSSGGATYQVPIMVSPGSHGLQPNLSIV